MEIYDITRTMQTAALYPGTPPFSMRRVSDLADEGYRECELTFYSHVGTHADAQAHFLPEGLDIAQMPVERFLGPCRVITVPADTVIGSEALSGELDGVCRLVLHGGGNTYLNAEAAAYLVQCGVQTVVTDAISIAPMDLEKEVHLVLLEAGAGIVENAVLDGVPDGDYMLSALPLRIAGCDGAPVRAVLFRE